MPRNLPDMNDVLTVLLAGGEGQRLYPLTRNRAKPAVAFGGQYRLVDFTLSNCLHSGCRRILVLVQYKYQSLARHLQTAWNLMRRELGEYLEIVPPQQRIGSRWYQGTADAIFQNLYSIEPANARDVLVLSADHIYKMDYRRMVQFHRESGADVTIASTRVPVRAATRFGILETDRTGRVKGFVEKPLHPHTVPGDPSTAIASMGIYLFSPRVLKRACCDDAARASSHDFGRDVLPRLIDNARVYAYPFEEQREIGGGYWRDVGTIESYWEAHMDLVDTEPAFDLYARHWPIFTQFPAVPPARFIYSDESRCSGLAVNSVVSPGCTVHGGTVVRSVLGPRVQVDCFAEIEESVLMQGVHIHPGVRLRRTIVEKNVEIPPGTAIGFDRADDMRRFRVSDKGIVVIDTPDAFTPIPQPVAALPLEPAVRVGAGFAP